MQKSIIIYILLLLFLFRFVPSTIYKNSYIKYESMTQALHLSAKVLIEATQKSEEAYDRLSEGIAYSKNNIMVDQNKLLEYFTRMVKNHSSNQETYEKTMHHIVAKVLVYHDHFIIADQQNHWTAPIFFTYHTGSQLIYLNTQDNEVYYYDPQGHKLRGQLSEFDLTQEEKQDLIIYKMNHYIGNYSRRVLRNKQLNIQIQNPYKQDGAYKATYQKFNVLDNITFFVVYAEKDIFGLREKVFNLDNYSVVGYTLDYERHTIN